MLLSQPMSRIRSSYTRGSGVPCSARPSRCSLSPHRQHDVELLRVHLALRAALHGVEHASAEHAQQAQAALREAGQHIEAVSNPGKTVSPLPRLVPPLPSLRLTHLMLTGGLTAFDLDWPSYSVHTRGNSVLLRLAPLFGLGRMSLLS